MFLAEVISIGDELTSGQRLDTNSQWLSERLGELGVRVVYHTTVADDLAANELVFRQAVARADIVVATGGLGPTDDDLTREALARATGAELTLDAPSLEHIRQLFARHKREMPARNERQALHPAGSRTIFNPNGTAPGIWLDAPRPGGGACRVFALPGVPAEMREMFFQTVAPAIAALAGSRVICHRRIKCFGAGESHLEEMLPDLIRRGRTPSVGITVHEATITLRITAEGTTPEECRAAVVPTIDTIRQCLGSLVFGEEDDELQHVVLRQLAVRGQTLATVEWGTAGLLAHWLSEAAGAESAYLGGLTVQNAEMLRSTLGIAAESATPANCFTAILAEAMAAACRQRTGADYALAIGPFPPADPAAAEPPAYSFALATPRKVTVKSATLSSHPSIWKPRAAKQAMNLLRLTLK